MNLVDYLVNNPDIPFEDKKDTVVWRGSTTGKRHKIANRYDLVERYYNYDKHKIDIAFCENKVINNNETVGITRNIYEKEELKKYVKPAMNIIEQLKYRFLISVEGNELASGLKWMLYSNSVVLMARPRNFSWIMENKLLPNYHYILLKDNFTDLEEKKDWCLNNLNLCKQISQNATQYMKQFLNIKNERKIEQEVIKLYSKNITIKNL